MISPTILKTAKSIKKQRILKATPNGPQPKSDISQGLKYNPLDGLHQNQHIL